MIPIKLILIFLLTFSGLYAIIYEDAEDKTISRWKPVDIGSLSSINNIYDSSKKSRVIEFQSDGTQHTYELKTTELKARKTNENGYWLSWQMKFSEDFVVIVLVQSDKGKHYLVYTPGIFKGHMQYGLGNATTNGKWQTFRRNLQEDIAYFDNRIEVISLESFVVKGNGRIDNIITSKTMLTEQKKLVKKKVIYEQKKVFKEPESSSPVITVRGSKFIKLSLGEPYIEEGVSAYDKEDGELNVVSMDKIDIYETGRSMILYMATDSDGNIALDRRFIEVGNVKVEEIKVKVEDDSENEEIDILEQETQVKIWEKALKIREKELAQREKKSNKS